MSSRKRHVRELYNPDQMHAVLRRERARADRQRGLFSLVLFHVDGLDVGESALLRLATVILKQVRETDEVGRFDRNTVCAVLPDTEPVGASMLIARVRQATHGRAYEPSCTVYTYPEPPASGSGRHDGEAHRDADDAGAGRGFRSGGPSVAAGADAFEDSSLAGERHVEAKPASDPRSPALAESTPPKSVGVAEKLDRRLEPDRSPASAIAMLSRPQLQRVAIPDDLEIYPTRSMSELLAEPLPRWKRAIDIVVASCAIVAASPVLLAAVAAIKLFDPGPAMFLQERTGLGGRPFKIYKLRTMRVDAEKLKDQLRAVSEQDGPAFKMTHDPRVTRIGRWLRKSSVDELPQLFNVLKGDMTLVGPRPLPIKEADGCEGWQYRRHDVTPGLTCIWQVEGRSRVKFDEWMRMDMRYAKRRRIWSDLALVLKTVPAVLLRRGAN